MSNKGSSGGFTLLAIAVAVALLAFFGVITLNTDDLNELINQLRDWATEVTAR